VNATPTGPTGPSPSQDDLAADTVPGRGAAGTGPAPRRRWKRKPLVAVGLLGGAMLLGGCDFYPTYWADRGATTQGHEIFKIYSGMMTTGIIVALIVSVLITWTLLRYRRRSDEMPRQFHEHIGIEMTYTIVPIIIVAVLFFFTVLTENNVDATVTSDTTALHGKPVVDITVTAFQWGWRFDYPNLDVGVAGELTNGPNDHGPQMVVPEGETVQITLVSDDTIHGFYVRDFNFSRYAQPGVTNVFDLNVIRLGTFDGQCTQFCGLYHTDMLFSVKSVTPSDFRQWASTQVAEGNTLQGSGSGAQNTAPNSSPNQIGCGQGNCPAGTADPPPQSPSSTAKAAA
jgi:cytochrome c oxidase subunit II